MRGEDVGYQAKVAQDAPASGNLVDDILNGRFDGNPESRPDSDADDLLGGGVDDTVADLLDDLHWSSNLIKIKLAFYKTCVVQN